MEALNITLNTTSFDITITADDNDMVNICIIDKVNDEAHMMMISERKAKTFMLDVFNNGDTAVEDLLVNQEEYM